MDPEINERTMSVERSRPSAVDRRVEERRQTTARLFTGSVLVIAVLYIARQVFIPIAVAILFAFILRPMVSYLERTFLRRIGAVTLAVALALGVVGLAGWAIASQVNSLAREVALYSGELEKKIRVLSPRPGGTIALFEETLDRKSVV